MEESDGSGDETCSMDLGPTALNQTMKVFHKKATAFSDLLKLQTEIDAKLKKRYQQTQNEFQQMVMERNSKIKRRGTSLLRLSKSRVMTTDDTDGKTAW